MVDYDFSGVDKVTAPQQPAPASTSGGYDFSGVDAAAEQAGPVGLAKNIVEQGLSGATAGISKAIQTKIGISTPEDIALRAQLHPVSTAASNIAGTGALLYTTGGLGELAEGAGLAGEAATAGTEATAGALGTAGQLGTTGKIIAGATEGGLIGGINQATDDFSNNQPLDAQKIAASAGIGALFGGGITGSLEGLSALGGKVAGKLESFNNSMRDLNINPDSPTIGDSFARGYQNALESSGKANDYINKVVQNLKDIKSAGNESTEGMYNAYKLHLNTALEDTPLPKAQSSAESVIQDMNAKLATTDQTGHIESALPKALDERLQSKIETLQSNLQNSQTAADVHNNLRNFATSLDKEIKFAGGISPTAAADQALLRDVRNVIRSNLGNAEVWGEDAATHYNKVTENYANFINSQKQFDTDFSKTRIAANGAKVKEIDPTKVKSFLNNVDDPSQALRIQSLDNHINALKTNAQEAANHESFESGMKQLIKRVDNLGANNIDAAKKIQLIKGMKKVQQGEGGVGTWVALEALPTALKYPAVVLRRYATKGGAGVAGGDLSKALSVTQKLANHVAKIDRRVDLGIKSIMYGSLSKQLKGRE